MHVKLAGTNVHRIPVDLDAALLALTDELENDDAASSLAWWILTGISVAAVLVALETERKRRSNLQPVGALEMASSALDELFTSETPWEPPLWNEARPEFAVS